MLFGCCCCSNITCFAIVTLSQDNSESDNGLQVSEDEATPPPVQNAGYGSDSSSAASTVSTPLLDEPPPRSAMKQPLVRRTSVPRGQCTIIVLLYCTTFFAQTLVELARQAVGFTEVVVFVVPPNKSLLARAQTFLSHCFIQVNYHRDIAKRSIMSDQTYR